MLRVELVGTLSSQVADEFVSAAVLPLTTAVLPTNPSAWVDCAVCCSDTNVASESLVLICCWTPANSTSCWVNWLVSSGSSGFWFCSCVVKSSRKLWKLPAICCDASAFAPEAALDVDDDPVCGVVPETTDVVISVSSNPDVDAAGGSDHAAIASSGDGRRGCVFVVDDQPLRVAVAAIVVVLSGGRLVAKAELQAA